jgi:Asp-tRNA(Asn)/Glu-tRNA(Gln) amidotransferase C subunit
VGTSSVVEKENILRKDKEEEKTISREDLLNCSNQKVIQNQIAISNIM